MTDTPEDDMSEKDDMLTRIGTALEYADRYGSIDGAHHKAWVIDQMVRALTGCPMVEMTRRDIHGTEYTYQTQGEGEEYRQFVADHKDGEDGPDTYDWDEGIAP